MGEITSLIRKIHTDKDAFSELVDIMRPLINKYVRLLYKDEKEDVRSEMVLALWEAVVNIKYFEKDGECMNYLCTALKNRFYELYRKSKKQNDNWIPVEDYDTIDLKDEADMENAVFRIDVEKFLESYSGKKREILKAMILGNDSDAEIGEMFYVTRQYVNRLRRRLYEELRGWRFG